MTEHAVLRVADQELAKRDEPLGDYDQFVDSIGVNSAQRSQREPLAARRSCNATLTSGRGWCGRQRHAAASCAAERREEHRHLRSVSGEG